MRGTVVKFKPVYRDFVRVLFWSIVVKKEGRKKGGREGGRKERKETSGVACVDKKKKKKEKKYSKPIFEHRIVLFIKPSPCNRDTDWGLFLFFFESIKFIPLYERVL